jgi:predicted transglutaminase-like cysteine proteinase
MGTLRRTALSAILPGLILLACFGKAQAGDFVAPAYNGYGFVTASGAPYDELRVAADFQAFGPLDDARYDLDTAALDPFETHAPSALRPSEPFASKTSALARGAIVDKWQRVQKALRGERRILARCRVDASTCPAAAKSFLAIIDKALSRGGWARIAEINRAVDLNIKPVTDMAQYGVDDRWVTPLALFASHAGDCEDYAIAKYVALQEIGISDVDLRLVIVHDRATREDHAVTAVRDAGRWQILDNRTLAIRQDVAIAEFKPLFIIGRNGVRRITPAPPNAFDVRPAAIATTVSF